MLTTGDENDYVGCYSCNEDVHFTEIYWCDREGRILTEDSYNYDTTTFPWCSSCVRGDEDEWQ